MDSYSLAQNLFFVAFLNFKQLVDYEWLEMSTIHHLITNQEQTTSYVYRNSSKTGNALKY